LNRFNGWKIHNLAMLVMLAIVLPLSVWVYVLDFTNHKGDALRNIDNQLLIAATMAEATLPADYHDRISSSTDVSQEDYDVVVERYNKLCAELGLEYLWSLMLVDGHPRFTSSTSPDKNVSNGLHAKFFEPHSNPELYQHAFQTMETQFRINKDKWGNIRAVLIPRYDAHGRKYLFGASKKMEDIHLLILHILRDAVLTAAAFLIPAVLLSRLVSKWLTKPISELAETAKKIGAGNYDQSITVTGAHEINVLSETLESTRLSFQRHIAELKSSVKEMQEFKDNVNNSPVIFFRVRIAPGFPTEFISDNIDFMGFTAADMISGKVTWDQFMYKDDLKKITEALNQTLESNGETYALEGRVIPPNGEIIWYENWNRILRDESGTPTHVQGLLIDITERKAARNRNIRYQNRLKALAQDLTHAEDKERRMLATAIHDDLGQMLAGLNMKFSVLKETSDRDRINDLVQQVDELLNQIMQACKSLTWEISPTSLYETDIAAGLERMASDLKKYFGLEVKIETAGIRIELDQVSAALIFRCIKELLVNIAKHSGTQMAEVGISRIENKVHMVVSDNGKGFNPSDQEEEASGFGLFSIKERLTHFNGSMHIESEPGKGTKILIILPLAPADPESDEYKKRQAFPIV